MSHSNNQSPKVKDTREHDRKEESNITKQKASVNLETGGAFNYLKTAVPHCNTL